MPPDTGLRWYMPQLPEGLLCNHCRRAPATQLVEGFTAWVCAECLDAELARCIESEREYLRKCDLERIERGE